MTLVCALMPRRYIADQYYQRVCDVEKWKNLHNCPLYEMSYRFPREIFLTELVVER